MPSNHLTKPRLFDIPIELSSLALKYGSRILTYELFNRANREKMLRSAASVAFSEYMAKIRERKFIHSSISLLSNRKEGDRKVIHKEFFAVKNAIKFRNEVQKLMRDNAGIDRED